MILLADEMTITEWEEIVATLHDFDSFEGDVPVAIRAAEHLHRSARVEDVPRLLMLLEDENFFVREAAAWPLSELAGAKYLEELLRAYQRGFDDGHDNDGFSAALADMALMDPIGVKQALQSFLECADESMQGHATWLLQFCREDI
jgi:hypothetical protein